MKKTLSQVSPTERFMLDLEDQFTFAVLWPSCEKGKITVEDQFGLRDMMSADLQVIVV